MSAFLTDEGVKARCTMVSDMLRYIHKRYVVSKWVCSEFKLYMIRQLTHDSSYMMVVSFFDCFILYCMECLQVDRRGSGTFDSKPARSPAVVTVLDLECGPGNLDRHRRDVHTP
jgi:hypothetical protein